MPTRRGFVPVDELREVIAARLASMSLRSVARAVGMSPSGLQKFVDGAVPYLPTRQKLERWYVRETAEYHGGMTLAAALAAVRVLIDDLPPPRQERAAQELVSTLARLYGEEDARPTWLEELIRELAPRPDR